MILSVFVGYIAVRFFGNLAEGAKTKALKTMGVVLLLGNTVVPLYGWLSPVLDMSWHRNLPIHLCGLNYIFVAVNCFLKNDKLFTFSAFTGTIGGIHALLTPQLTIGDAPLVLFNYYFSHLAIVVVPIIMANSFGFRFPKWGWIWTYVATAVLTTSVGGFNWVLNTYLPSDITANYMYMWEAPKADNPFVTDLAWPFYILPLHAALILHLMVINGIYRWRLPMNDWEMKSWQLRFLS